MIRIKLKDLSALTAEGLILLLRLAVPQLLADAITVERFTKAFFMIVLPAGIAFQLIPNRS